MIELKEDDVPFPNQPQNSIKGDPPIMASTMWNYHLAPTALPPPKPLLCLQENLGKRNKNRYHPLLKCCRPSITSSQPSLAEGVELKLHHELKGNYGTSRKENFGYLVSDGDENGWVVRKMVDCEDEIRKVAKVQAEAFHQPVFLFNHLFFEVFKAEVLSGLVYRLRNSPPDRYACLVAEHSKDEIKEVVGVVDVTVYRDDDVVGHLEEADEYLYISGIAVLPTFRRQKVATALLKACEMVADLWGFKYLVLRAYEDDFGAQKLYNNAGYKVVSMDPPWMSSWIGQRRRVLMIKQSKKVYSL